MIKFIETSVFRRGWERLGLDDDDFAKLQELISTNPACGDVIRGGGVLGSFVSRYLARGRGAVRVIYASFVVHDTVLLIEIYTKNEQSNLDRSQLKSLGKMIKSLKDDLGKE